MNPDLGVSDGLASAMRFSLAASRGFASITSSRLPAGNSAMRARVTAPVPAPASSTEIGCPASARTGIVIAWESCMPLGNTAPMPTGSRATSRMNATMSAAQLTPSPLRLTLSTLGLQTISATRDERHIVNHDELTPIGPSLRAEHRVHGGRRTYPAISVVYDRSYLQCRRTHKAAVGQCRSAFRRRPLLTILTFIAVGHAVSFIS